MISINFFYRYFERLVPKKALGHSTTLKQNNHNVRYQKNPMHPSYQTAVAPFDSAAITTLVLSLVLKTLIGKSKKKKKAIRFKL